MELLMTEEKTISAFKYLRKQIDNLQDENFELRDKLEKEVKQTDKALAVEQLNNIETINEELKSQYVLFIERYTARIGESI